MPASEVEGVDEALEEAAADDSTGAAEDAVSDSAADTVSDSASETASDSSVPAAPAVPNASNSETNTQLLAPQVISTFT